MFSYLPSASKRNSKDGGRSIGSFSRDLSIHSNDFSSLLERAVRQYLRTRHSDRAAVFLEHRLSFHGRQPIAMSRRDFAPREMEGVATFNPPPPRVAALRPFPQLLLRSRLRNAASICIRSVLQIPAAPPGSRTRSRFLP